MHTLKRLWCCIYISVYRFSGAYKLYHMSTTMQNNDLGTGDLCNNIGFVGVFAKWSYVTGSPCHHDRAIPILSPLLFMHVGHPYIPLFKIRRIFNLLVYIYFIGVVNWKLTTVCHAFNFTHTLFLGIHVSLSCLLYFLCMLPIPIFSLF